MLQPEHIAMQADAFVGYWRKQMGGHLRETFIRWAASKDLSQLDAERVWRAALADLFRHDPAA